MNRIIDKHFWCLCYWLIGILGFIAVVYFASLVQLRKDNVLYDIKVEQMEKMKQTKQIEQDVDKLDKTIALKRHIEIANMCSDITLKKIHLEQAEKLKKQLQMEKKKANKIEVLEDKILRFKGKAQRTINIVRKNALLAQVEKLKKQLQEANNEQTR